jgi:biopolymer transport protein ExbD
VRLVRRTPRRARIEIIPMIDTVFFLLVFFMMASLAMAVYRGVPVRLPHAATGQAAPAENVTVTVTQDGQMYLDKEPVAPETLGDRLRARVAGDPELAVVINADADVVHGRVVDVLDQARGAGVSRLAIAIVPREGGARP